jgi:hypothetical protein
MVTMACGVRVEFDAVAAMRTSRRSALRRSDDALATPNSGAPCLLCDLDQFVDDVRGAWPDPDCPCRKSMISTPVARCCGLEFIDDVENIGRQAFDTLKFFHPGCCY